MKNKYFLNLKVLIINLFFLLILCKFSIADQINLTADKIETIGNNIIKASQNVIIKNEKGVTIFANDLVANNEKENYIIENNVTLKDEINKLDLISNKIFFNKKENIIKSVGHTIIKGEKNFELESSDITFDRQNKIIFTKKKSEIKDMNFNKLILKDLFISLENDYIKSEEGLLIDKEQNQFEIKNIFYNFSRKEIIGKDIDLNNRNQSDKIYVPRMKGNSIFYDKNNVVVNKSVFTNCKKRDGCPPWLFKAEEIKHDKQKKVINYKNAWLNIYDVPVFYFPKFFHPDPSVKRQSGFLVPSFNQVNNSGDFLEIPYFFAISENRDFTLSPKFFSDNKVLYQGEYRHVTENTKNILDASIKNDSVTLLDKNSTNSHLFFNSTVNLENNFFDISELKMQVQSTSSDNYLKSYNIKSPLINSQTTLNSQILFEGITDDIDFSISTEIYEDLTKTNDSDKFEYIFPSFDFVKEIDTDLNGIFTTSHSGYNKLYQTNVSENVLINDISFKSSDYITNDGIVSNYSILLKNFNIESNNSKKYKNEFESDLNGIFQFYSKLPLEKKGNRYNSSLSPIFVAKLSPNTTKNLRNQDRLVDYNNIYSINRIGSNETLEGGESITIGNEFSIFDKQNQLNELFNINLAASFRGESNESLSKKSSLGQKTSNIVGQIKLVPSKFYEIEYNFLADNNIEEFNYHKLSTTFKINNFISNFEFFEENNLIGDNSYLSNETNFKIDDNKNLKFKARKNKKTNLTEYYNLIYQYKMDCLVAGIEYKKDYYTDVGIKPSEKILFSVTIMPFQNTLELPSIDK